MFRFTIRDLLLATVIVSMGFAWWLDRQALLYSLNAYRDSTMLLEKFTDARVVAGKNASGFFTHTARIQVLDEEAQLALDRIDARDAELRALRRRP